MKNRRDQPKKERDSDDEQEIDDEMELEAAPRPETEEERLARELENTPTIPDDEISPAAYIFQNQEEHDDLNLYEEKSTKIKCPFCDAVSLSIVEYQPSLLGYLLVLLAMLVFGFLSLVLLPFLVSLTKSAIHRCAKCLNEVKTTSYFGFSSMEDKLVTLSIGKFGIILTRKLLLYCALVITLILTIYVFVLVEEGHNHEMAPISAVTWATYREDCGYDAFMRNPKKATHSFDRQYWGTGVSWKGYVVRVNLNEEDPMSMAYHSASLLVKMEIDDRSDAKEADIGLSLSQRVLNQYSHDISDLHRGDYIEFNSTIQSMGDSHHLHHLHTFSIKKLEGHKDVEAHAHQNGRYKIRKGEKEQMPVGSFGSDPTKTKVDDAHHEDDDKEKQPLDPNIDLSQMPHS